MRLIALALLLAACGSDEPSALDKERARARDACMKGDGPSCLVAGAAFDYTKKDQLGHAMEAWTRGCELGNGACCGQLGTAAEFGMASGGASPDMATATMYYSRACKLGDAKSCTNLGMPAPEGTNVTAKDAIDWRKALTPICGKGHGELGPLFSDLALGEPMPAAMNDKIAAFEKKFHAHVHYYAGDRALLSAWSLDVRFDEGDAIWPVLVRGWGQPDLPFGAWASDTTHVIAYWTHDDRGGGVSWTPYRSITEVIRPDDKTVLGFEPFPIVGSKLVDLQQAKQMLRSAEDEYRWTEIGPGPGFEVHVIEKRGVITELRTVNWITNSPKLGDALLAALETKWGAPKIDKAGTHTWKLPGRVVRASKPASGNFEIVIEKT